MQKVEQRSNQVLVDGHRASENFYLSDKLLQVQLQALLPSEAMSFLNPMLQWIGAKAALEMDALSLTADKNGPQLVKRDKWGENIDEIRFHPAYGALMEIAVSSGMMRLKWEPNLRKRFHGQRHKMGFAIGLLYGMSESGQYCPLCMTDGVAHLIDQFCNDEDRDRLLPHIYTEEVGEFFTGAMFLTEKAGGSDVGANTVQATDLGDGYHALKGEKWFCSNVNADIIFALARTQEEVHGTRGLSIFLVERKLPNGKPNPINIVRLKDKLGTRSMASGECLLDGTVGKMVGPEFQGFKVMTEMINLSRMYNSVAALAGGRRALIEAYQFLSFRITFGKIALEHSLVRLKLWELGSLHCASFHLVWRAVAAMDAAEAGNTAEAELLRMLTPMVKRDSAELAVYLCRESMELMGGMGYIEDTVMPKMMRDVMVLPIWEGAGNIMVLDMLRAATKSNGLALMLEEIKKICQVGGPLSIAILSRVFDISSKLEALQSSSQEEMEYQAKDLFLKLTRCYQAALVLNKTLADPADTASRLALEWLLKSMGQENNRTTSPTRLEIESLIAWEI